MTEPSLLARAALLGVRSRPVPQEALLRALLAQDGHYVASEVVDLMALAGVAPITGYGVVTKLLPPPWLVNDFIVPDDDSTPGFASRVVDGHCAMLWSEMGQPPAFKASCAAAAEDPASMALLAAACGRYGECDVALELSFEPEQRRVYFPWGTASRTEKWYANKNLGFGKWRKAPEGAAEHHHELLREGSVCGVVALVVGRLLSLGHEIVEVGGARWLVELRGEAKA